MAGIFAGSLTGAVSFVLSFGSTFAPGSARWMPLTCATDVLRATFLGWPPPQGGPSQLWLLLTFALAFAVKAPVWPLHTWLPDAYVESPAPATVRCRSPFMMRSWLSKKTGLIPSSRIPASCSILRG